MMRHASGWALILGFFCAGCATLDPSVKVNEAADLVERRLGERPAWDVPWDDTPAAWIDDGELTIEEAVAVALRNNRELRADLETIGAAQADLVQAGLLQNPVLSLMVMFPESGGRSMLRGNGFPMQPLQDLWLRPAREKVADAKLQEAVLRVTDRAVETAAAVKRTYAKLQFAQRAVEILHENMAVVERSTQLIQSRQIGGKATQVEVNLSRIKRLQLKSEWVTMQAEARELKRELLSQMGLAAASDGWTVAGIHELEETLPLTPVEDEVVAAAQTQRLDLLAAGWSLQAADREVELMHLEGWPEMALGLTFERAPAPRSQNQTLAGRLGNSVYQGATNTPAEPAAMLPYAPKPRDMKYTVGPMLEMELPIFDRNQAGVAKAVHEYRRAFAEYDAKRQEVIMNVRRAFVAWERSAEQVRFFRTEIIPEVEQNLRLVEQSYRSGQEALTVYLQVYEDLLMNRLRLLEHLRDLLVSRVDLERQLGGSLETAALDPVLVPSSTGE